MMLRTVPGWATPATVRFLHQLPALCARLLGVRRADACAEPVRGLRRWLLRSAIWYTLYLGLNVAVKARQPGWDGNYRRTIVGVTLRQVVPVAVLLVALVGLFAAAQSGQQRIADASRRVEAAALRHRVLSDVLQLLTQAESAQRGYLLVGDPSYLVPFTQSTLKIAQALHRLDDVFVTADAAALTQVKEIQGLAEAKLTELNQTLDLYRSSGPKPTLELIRSDVGQRTMIELTEAVRRIQSIQTTEIVEASRSWRADLWVTRWITSGGLILNVFLILLVRRLVLRDMRNREREAEELAERRTELEEVVKSRTEQLSDLSTHLQSLAEQEKAALARELHDELGGLLVAARMDVSWLEARVASGDAEVQSHFKRLHEALQTGVDVKRRVVENLRPTLLDNLGLFPALRWQVADSCGRAGLECVELYPAEEPLLTPEASIAVFRIVQESLTNILKHARAQRVEVTVESQANWLVVRIRDDGIGLGADRLRAIGSHGLAAMRHRAEGLGGSWRIAAGHRNGTQIEVRLPFTRVRLEASV